MSYFVVRRVASHDEMEIIGAGGSPVEVAPIALAARQRGDWVRVYESPIGAQAMRRAEREYREVLFSQR